MGFSEYGPSPNREGELFEKIGNLHREEQPQKKRRDPPKISAADKRLLFRISNAFHQKKISIPELRKLTGLSDSTILDIVHRPGSRMKIYERTRSALKEAWAKISDTEQLKVQSSDPAVAALADLNTKFSQAAIGKQIGVSHRTISNWKLGVYKIAEDKRNEILNLRDRWLGPEGKSKSPDSHPTARGSGLNFKKVEEGLTKPAVLSTESKQGKEPGVAISSEGRRCLEKIPKEKLDRLSRDVLIHTINCQTPKCVTCRMARVMVISRLI